MEKAWKIYTGFHCVFFLKKKHKTKNTHGLLSDNIDYKFSLQNKIISSMCKIWINKELEGNIGKLKHSFNEAIGMGQALPLMFADILKLVLSQCTIKHKWNGKWAQNLFLNEKIFSLVVWRQRHKTTLYTCGSKLGTILLPRAHLSISGDIFGFHNSGGTSGI